MSVLRMFLAGLLVAGGIILGAFTLNGYLDPRWHQQQMQAMQAREQAGDPASINTFHNRSRFVGRSEPATPEAVRPAAVKPSPKSNAADVRPAPKPAAPKKKVADKPADKDKKAEPQQASFQWPWQKLFGSN